MKKLLAAVATCAMLATFSQTAMARRVQVPAYTWSHAGDSIAFEAVRTSDMLIVSPREGDAQCARDRRNDTWGAFVANVSRDTTNLVYVQVGKQCSNGDEVVCVDVEDFRTGERSFDPQVCATLHVEWD